MEENTSEVHCEQKRAAVKHLLIHPATCQDLSVSIAGLPAANLVVETILVEDGTQALMVQAVLVVHLLRLLMHPILEALTKAVHQAPMLNNLELEVAK